MRDSLRKANVEQSFGQQVPAVEARAPIRTYSVETTTPPTPDKDLVRVLQSLNIDTCAMPLDLYKSLLYRDPNVIFESGGLFQHRPLESHEKGSLVYAYVASVCRELRDDQLQGVLAALFEKAEAAEAQALLLDALLESGSFDADAVIHHCIRERIIHQEALDRVYARQRSRSPAILRRLETYRYTAGVYAYSLPTSSKKQEYSGLQRSALDVTSSFNRLLSKLREDSRALVPFQSDPSKLRTLEHTLYDLQMLTERRDSSYMLRSNNGLECVEVLLAAARNFTYESVPDCLKKSLEYVLSSGAPTPDLSATMASSRRYPVDRLLDSVCVHDRDITVLQRLLGGNKSAVSHLAVSVLALTAGSRDTMLSILHVTKNVLSTSHGYERLREALKKEYASIDALQNDIQMDTFFDCVGIEDVRASLPERLAHFVALLKHQDHHTWRDYADIVFSPELDFSIEQRGALLARRVWTPEMKLEILERFPDSLVSFLHRDPFFRSLHHDALLQVEQHLSATLLRSGEQMPVSDIMRTLAVIARGSPLESRRLFHRLLQDPGFQEALHESLSADGEQLYEGPRPILAVLYASLAQGSAPVFPHVSEATPGEAPRVRMASLPRLIVFLDRTAENPAVQTMVAAAEKLCYALYRQDHYSIDVSHRELCLRIKSWEEDPTVEAICSVHDRVLLEEVRSILTLFEEGDPDRRFLRMLSKGIVRLSDNQDPAVSGQQLLFLHAVQHFVSEEHQYRAQIHRKSIRDVESYCSEVSERILALLPVNPPSTSASFSSLFARAFGFLRIGSDGDIKEDIDGESEGASESEGPGTDDTESSESDLDDGMNAEDADQTAAQEDSELHPWSPSESTELPSQNRGTLQPDVIAEIVPPLVGSERYLVEALFSQYRKSSVQYSALGQDHHEEDAEIRAFLRDTYLHMQSQETREVRIQYAGVQDKDALPLPTGSVLVPPVAIIEGGREVRLQVNKDLGYRFQSPDTSLHTLSVKTQVCSACSPGEGVTRDALQRKLGTRVFHSLTRAAVSLEEFPEAFQERIVEARTMEDVSRASDHILEWIQTHYQYDKSALEHPDYQSHIHDGPYSEDDPDHYLAAIHGAADSHYDGATICGGFTHLAVQAMRLAGIPVLYGRGFYVSDSGSDRQSLRAEDKHAFPMVLTLDELGMPRCIPREATPEEAGYGFSLSMNLSMPELARGTDSEDADLSRKTANHIEYVSYFQGMFEALFPETSLSVDQRDKLTTLYMVLDTLRQDRSQDIRGIVQSCAEQQHDEKRDRYEAFISSWQRLVNPDGLALLRAVQQSNIPSVLAIDEGALHTFLEFAEVEWLRLEKHFESFEFDPSIFDLPVEDGDGERR